MAAPEITRTVRQMFETGQVVGRREVKKTRPSSELASESGVFENEPTTADEGVVRSADFPTSDVDQVICYPPPQVEHLVWCVCLSGQ